MQQLNKPFAGRANIFLLLLLCGLGMWSGYVVGYVVVYVVWVCGLCMWSGYVVWICGLGMWSGYVVWVRLLGHVYHEYTQQELQFHDLRSGPLKRRAKIHTGWLWFF